MPAPPRRRTTLLLVSVLAVLTAILVVVFVLRLARSPGAKVNLGDQEFSVGHDTVFAAAIGHNRRPLFFPALRGSLTLFVQHLGTDPAHGWLAFSAQAQAPGRRGSCVVQWDLPHQQFQDCTGAQYPPDGTGLDQYPVRVDPGGTVIINLRQPIGTVPPSQ
ncbi:MAG: hypothetical protein M3N98_04235 [Actinomycetota bacterium]|nr:hypothetical protein [Actinomycetota bacterium]